MASQFILENVMYVHRNIDRFTKNCDIHQINTRNKNKLAIPVTRLRRVCNYFVGGCIRFYNRIPENVKTASVAKFKKIVKKRLCVRGYYDTKDFINDDTPWE